MPSRKKAQEWMEEDEKGGMLKGKPKKKGNPFGGKK